MNPQNKQHFAITVHYGDPAPTNKAIESLLLSTNPPDHIVVINHSQQPLSLKNDHRLTVVKPEQNSGYAAGINMGLGIITTLNAAPEDIVTCFNNDVLFAPDTYTKLRQWWSDHPDGALLGLTAIPPHQTPQASGYVNLFTGRCQLSSIALSTRQRQSFFTLPYIHGACFSASLDLLLLNHGLPTAYFMYWEDVLFSQQIARRHFPLITMPGLSVTHSHPSPNRAAQNKKLYYLVRNGALFLEQETPGLWRYYWWVLNRLRYLYHRLRQQQPIVIKALADAISRTTGPATITDR